MKHIIRKPMLPCVLLILLSFSVCFMTLFQQSILDGQAAVEDMYNSVQLTFQVLPATGANGVLKLRNKTAEKLLQVEGAADCAYYLECPYSLRSPVHFANYSVAYGTNDLSFFSKERGVEISFAEGWNEAAVLNPGEMAVIPCILDSILADALDIEAGDTFAIAPNADEDTDPEAAPTLTMVAAGTFENNKGLVEPYSILVSDKSFWGRSGFLYNGLMMGDFYYYRAFHLYIDPAYNREFQPIREAAKAALEKDGDFILYSNARILERAVRPIEQKVRIQQMLVTPLSILLCVATAVMVLFLCAGFSTEVLLRLLWGENRTLVWLKIIGSVLLLMAVEGLIALIIVWLICGVQWIGWAAQYMAMIVAVCFAAMAIQQALFCTRNMVAFYQSREE